MLFMSFDLRMSLGVGGCHAFVAQNTQLEND